MNQKTNVSELAVFDAATLADAVKTDARAPSMAGNVRLGVGTDGRLIGISETTGKKFFALNSEEMVAALFLESVDPDNVFGIDWHSDVDSAFRRIPWPQVNEIKALLRHRIAASLEQKLSSFDPATHRGAISAGSIRKG